MPNLSESIGALQICVIRIPSSNILQIPATGEWPLFLVGRRLG